MVLLFAAIVGTENFAVSALVWAGQPRALVVSARLLMFLGLGVSFWYNRRGRLLPTSAAERELWTIWIGYFTTHCVIVLVIYLLRHLEILQPHVDWSALE